MPSPAAQPPPPAQHPPAGLVHDDLLRLACRSAGIGMWFLDFAADEIVWTPEFAAILGLPPGQNKCSRLEFRQWLHPEDAERVIQQVQEARERKVPEYQIEHRLLRPDGSVRWVEARGEVQFDAAGQPLRMLGAIMDITERRQLAETEQDAQARLNAIVETTPNVAIQTYAADGRVLTWNRASEQMFGFSPAETIGKTLDQLIHTPDEARQFVELLGSIAATRQAIGPAEYHFKRKDGSRGWCLSTTFSIDTPGRPPIFACMDVDITERKASEQALRESEQRYRTLVEYAPEAQVIFDCDLRRFVEANPSATALFGMTLDELLRTGPMELSPPTQADGRSSADAVVANVDRALAGETPSFGWIHRNKAGVDIPCEVRLVRLPATGRRLVRGSITDIRERLRLEEQLHQAQKMESIGRLAGGIAHDFNNLLTSIIIHTELAQEAALDAASRAHLETVALAARRSADLTSQLLAFARRQVISPRTVNLNEAIADSQRLLRRVIGEPIELVTVFHPDSPMARVDPGQLSQVVINLTLNARDAMPRGGRLILETGFADLDAKYAERHADVQPGRYVLLTVSDTGAGISPAVQEKIFEPFFTTKGPGQGTGLGLATCYGIVKQHKGHLAVYSEPGRGTTFRIYLPAANPAIPEPPPAPQPRPGPGFETVFLCEDEEMLCELGVEILTSNGYRVTAAMQGTELLHRARAASGAIDLLITDLVMPDMSGPELAAQLRALRPGLKVLYVSGYSEHAALHNGHLEAGAHFLPKPFSLADFIRKVREVLDQPA